MRFQLIHKIDTSLRLGIMRMGTFDDRLGGGNYRHPNHPIHRSGGDFISEF